jgi:FtsP/CotA-like multicopper oxidase with cupredoxin domain
MRPLPSGDRPIIVTPHTRRPFLRGAGLAGVAVLGRMITPVSAQTTAGRPDYTLRIAPMSLELAPGRIVQTVGYNGTVPGPIIRLREGQQTTIEVTNHTAVPELVHWHGLIIPAAVDGAMEEGTPMVMPGQSAVYTF